MTESLLRQNPLCSRADVQEAVRQLCVPLKRFYSPGRARVRLGGAGVIYGRTRAEMEAFARPFWGLVPLAAGGGESDLWDNCREGLLNGTDRQHPEYWGNLTDLDQLAVEMPPLALALVLAPRIFWGPFGSNQRAQIGDWLYQINTKRVADNNWRFFPILVNVALRKVGLPFDGEVIEAGLRRIEAFYCGDGWYADGPVPRMDYYIAFAMHFYSLIYAKLAGEEDPSRADLFRERAGRFARDFVHWFTAEGAALPYGRSLTYRFAQGAFWGAAAFAELEVFPWGQLKGLYLRHLRHWLRQPVYQADGTLSVGYAYPNLLMSEFYNASGSPYWALKAFLPLALSSDHPFWTASEEAYPERDTISVQKHARMLLTASHDHRHVIALTSGQGGFADYGHSAEKYGKFAYSTHFGFSVSRDSVGLEQGAYDSMLALSDDGKHWRVRSDCEAVEVTKEWIYSRWCPWPDVEVRTWLVPCHPWHVRIHEIRTERFLHTAEGGFAVPCEESPGGSEGPLEVEAGIYFRGSGLRDLAAFRKARLISVFPNTNVIHPRTVLPTLLGVVEPGASRLICAVLGEPDSAKAKHAWTHPPETPEVHLPKPSE